MDLLYLLKENFKNLLFDLLITGENFENLSYLSSFLLSQRWRFRRIHSNVLRGIESNHAYTKVLGVASQYILRSGSLWHPLSSSMLKNRRIFSLVISLVMSAFSLWLYNLVEPKIILNQTNASLKNKMRSLRGVIISSSVLNFEMFAHSTTLISRLYNIYFGLPYLSQESMVLSQVQLAYLYYLELSLTVLQNYRITAFVNLWLTPLKYQKKEKITTTK